MKKAGFPFLGILFLTVLLCGTGCGAGKNANTATGMEAIANLDYDTALESFAAAQAAGEDKRSLYRGQGLAYMGKVMYEEAAASLEQALSCSDGQIDAMDYDINYYLATAYYKMGDKEKAVAAYDAILALKPGEEDAHYLRGALEAEEGNLEPAQADFDQVIALDPQNYDRLINIYGILEQNGFKEAGQTYLQSAIGSETKTMTNYEKGRICYYMEDYENARTYLEKARDEGGYEAILFLGKTYETLGDYNYAISVYNSYLSGSEQNAEVYNQLGLCRLRTGEYDGALTAFQTAMKIEDNSIMQTLKLNEIVAYEYLEEYKKAAVLTESYLKTYPDDEAAAREYIFLKTR